MPTGIGTTFTDLSTLAVVGYVLSGAIAVLMAGYASMRLYDPDANVERKKVSAVHPATAVAATSSGETAGPTPSSEGTTAPPRARCCAMFNRDMSRLWLKVLVDSLDILLLSLIAPFAAWPYYGLNQNWTASDRSLALRLILICFALIPSSRLFVDATPAVVQAWRVRKRRQLQPPSALELATLPSAAPAQMRSSGGTTAAADVAETPRIYGQFAAYLLNALLLLGLMATTLVAVFYETYATCLSSREASLSASEQDVACSASTTHCIFACHLWWRLLSLIYPTVVVLAYDALLVYEDTGCARGTGVVPLDSILTSLPASSSSTSDGRTPGGLRLTASLLSIVRVLALCGFSGGLMWDATLSFPASRLTNQEYGVLPHSSTETAFIVSAESLWALLLASILLVIPWTQILPSRYYQSLSSGASTPGSTPRSAWPDKPTIVTPN